MKSRSSCVSSIEKDATNHTQGVRLSYCVAVFIEREEMDRLRCVDLESIISSSREGNNMKVG